MEGQGGRWSGNGGAPCWPHERGEPKGSWNPLDGGGGRASNRRDREGASEPLDRKGSSNSMDSERALRLLDTEGSWNHLDREGVLTSLVREMASKCLARELALRALDREGASRPLDREGASNPLDREGASNPLDREGASKTPSPQSGKGRTTPYLCRELSPPSSRTTYRERSSSGTRRDPHGYGGNPEVSQGRWDSPERESRRRSWESLTKEEDPSKTWTFPWKTKSPPPRSSGLTEWVGSERLRWPEKPGGSSSSRHQMRWGDPEGRSDPIAVGGSGEWQRGRVFQSFARGDWGSRGGGGSQDPTREQKAWGGPVWKEGRSFRAHSPFYLTERQRKCHIPGLEGGEEDDRGSASIPNPFDMKKWNSSCHISGLEGEEDEDPQSANIQSPLGVKKRKGWCYIPRLEGGEDEDPQSADVQSPLGVKKRKSWCYIPGLEGGDDEDPQHANVPNPLGVKKHKSWYHIPGLEEGEDDDPGSASFPNPLGVKKWNNSCYFPGLEEGEDEDPQSADVQSRLCVQKQKISWEVRGPEGRVDQDPGTASIQGQFVGNKRKIRWDVQGPEGRVDQNPGTVGVQSPLGVKRWKIRSDVRGPEGMIHQDPGSVGILTHIDLKTPRSRENLPRERKDEGWARDEGLEKISSSKEYEDVQVRIRQACQKVKEYLNRGVGGSTDHPKSLKLQHGLQDLKAINPLSIEMTGQKSSGPHMAGDKVNLLKATVNTFPEVATQKPLAKNFTNHFPLISGPNLDAVPLQSHAGCEGAPSWLHKQSSDPQTNAPKPQKGSFTSLELWHRRFAHADPKAILELENRNLAEGIRVDPSEAESIARCAICRTVKGGVASFPQTTVKSSAKVLDLIHCELCEPFNVLSRDHHRYVLIFVDDFSRYCVTYLLSELEDAGMMLSKYMAILKDMKGNPKAFLINNMDNRFSQPMECLLEKSGIPHKRGGVSTSRQSRTAEREMKSLVEMVQCMLADTKVPNNFWGDAIMTATYLWNRLPVGGSSSNTQTPFRLWFGKTPTVRHLRVFGSLLYLKLRPNSQLPQLLIGHVYNDNACNVMDLETGLVFRRHQDLEKIWQVEERGSFLDAFPGQGHDTGALLATSGSTPSQPELGGKQPGSNNARDETKMVPVNSSGQLPAGNQADLLKAVVKTFSEVNLKKLPDSNAIPLLPRVRPKRVRVRGKYRNVYSDQQVNVASLELWHRRFAHADPKAVLELENRNLATGIKVDTGDAESTARCETCLRVKGGVASSPLTTVKSTAKVLDLIHCELCGPFNVLSRGQNKYALIFVDDFSRYCVTYLLSDLQDTGMMLSMYMAMIRKEKPKAFQINSVDEGFSQLMESLLDKAGLPHKRNVERTPGQNRTAERELRSLLEMTQCMLEDAKLPSCFWSYAIKTATYLYNRLPGDGGTETPFHLWDGTPPGVGQLRVFGSLAYHKRNKSRRLALRLLGYDHNKATYNLMRLETGNSVTKYTNVFSVEHTWVEETEAFVDAFPGQSHDTGALLVTVTSTTSQLEKDRKQPDVNDAQDEAEVVPVSEKRLKQRLTLKLLRATNPSPIGTTGQNSSCLNLLKAAVKTPEKPPKMNVKHDVSQTTLVDVPLQSHAHSKGASAQSSVKQANTPQLVIQDFAGLELWHRRFAHTDPKAILELENRNLAKGIKVDPWDAESTARCETCLKVKGSVALFPLTTVKSSAKVLDLIHCELCEPFNVLSRDQHRYVLIFVDDFSRYCTTYLLSELEDIGMMLSRYMSFLKRMKRKPKEFQINNMDDRFSQPMECLLEKNGIPHRRIVVSNPGQSRTAEREMKSLVEMARCMLGDAKLPDNFWGYAIRTATYLWNRLPVSGSSDVQVPFYLWFGQQPTVGHLRVFGSLVYQTSQLPLLLIGYVHNYVAYNVMDFETGQVTTRVLQYLENNRWVEERGAFLDAFPGQGHDTGALLAMVLSTPSQPESHRKRQGDKARDEVNTPGDRNGDPVRAQEASVPAFGCTTQPAQSERKEEWDDAGDKTKMPVDGDVVQAQEAPAFVPSLPPAEPLPMNESSTHPDIAETPAVESTELKDIKTLPGMMGSTLSLPLESERKESRDEVGDESSTPGEGDGGEKVGAYDPGNASQIPGKHPVAPAGWVLCKKVETLIHERLDQSLTPQHSLSVLVAINPLPAETPTTPPVSERKEAQDNAVDKTKMPVDGDIIEAQEAPAFGPSLPPMELLPTNKPATQPDLEETPATEAMKWKDIEPLPGTMRSIPLPPESDRKEARDNAGDETEMPADGDIVESQEAPAPAFRPSSPPAELLLTNESATQPDLEDTPYSKMAGV